MKNTKTKTKNKKQKTKKTKKKGETSTFFQIKNEIQFWEEKYLYMKDTIFCMWQLHFLWNKGTQEQVVCPVQYL